MLIYFVPELQQNCATKINNDNYLSISQIFKIIQSYFYHTLICCQDTFS